MIHDLPGLLAATGFADVEALSAEIEDQIEMDSWVEVEDTGITLVTSSGASWTLTFPFAEVSLWEGVRDLDGRSAEDLEAQAFAHGHVLAHCDPVDSELYGVWLWTGQHVESFYPGGEMSAEHQYAEAVVLADTWVAQMASLPGSSPYLANWVAVPMVEGETAEAAFGRLAALNDETS